MGVCPVHKRAEARDEEETGKRAWRVRSGSKSKKKKSMYEEGGGNAVERDDDLFEDSTSSEQEGDANLEAGWDSGLLSKEDIIFFRRRMSEVVLPRGVSRLPDNIGE